MSSLSHSACPADLPSLSPDSEVTRGSVTPYTLWSHALLTRSKPAVMFPIWSLPPSWTVQPCALYKWYQSYA